MKMKKMRLALYVVLACMLLASAVSVAYSKYISSHSTDKFDIFVTAGTIEMSMIGGSSGNVLVPGTYVNVPEENKPVVQIKKDSEECYVFVKVGKTTNVKDIINVYTNNASYNSEEGYVDGVWYILASDLNADTGERFDVIYRRVTKTELKERAGAGEYASYPVLRYITEATPGPLWVKPDTATETNLAKITADDKITFTAYAVQVTPGIGDPVTAWNKLNIHTLGTP